jgi:phosphoenolpyruvate---glycerone phosphotransferase subunit DhaL
MGCAGLHTGAAVAVMSEVAESDCAQSEAVARRIFSSCLHAVCAGLLQAERELCELDQIIGDGDHGSNVGRAATALLEAEEKLLRLPIGEALERAGLLIVMSIGGASGPLYGSLLMAMGRAWPDQANAASAAAAFSEGVDALARRGRASTGEKTMLDVLRPAAEAFGAAGSTNLSVRLKAMLDAADAHYEASRSLVAKRGRAAYVGARSVGQVDPGAASSRLCLHAVAGAIQGARASGGCCE